MRTDMCSPVLHCCCLLERICFLYSPTQAQTRAASGPEPLDERDGTQSDPSPCRETAEEHPRSESLGQAEDV